MRFWKVVSLNTVPKKAENPPEEMQGLSFLGPNEHESQQNPTPQDQTNATTENNNSQDQQNQQNAKSQDEGRAGNNEDFDNPAESGTNKEDGQGQKESENSEHNLQDDQSNAPQSDNKTSEGNFETKESPENQSPANNNQQNKPINENQQNEDLARPSTQNGSRENAEENKSREASQNTLDPNQQTGQQNQLNNSSETNPSSEATAQKQADENKAGEASENNAHSLDRKPEEQGGSDSQNGDTTQNSASTSENSDEKNRSDRESKDGTDTQNGSDENNSSQNGDQQTNGQQVESGQQQLGENSGNDSSSADMASDAQSNFNTGMPLSGMASFGNGAGSPSTDGTEKTDNAGDQSGTQSSSEQSGSNNQTSNTSQNPSNEGTCGNENGDLPDGSQNKTQNTSNGSSIPKMLNGENAQQLSEEFGPLSGQPKQPQAAEKSKETQEDNSSNDANSNETSQSAQPSQNGKKPQADVERSLNQDNGQSSENPKEFQNDQSNRATPSSQQRSDNPQDSNNLLEQNQPLATNSQDGNEDNSNSEKNNSSLQTEAEGGDQNGERDGQNPEVQNSEPGQEQNDHSDGKQTNPSETPNDPNHPEGEKSPKQESIGETINNSVLRDLPHFSERERGGGFSIVDKDVDIPVKILKLLISKFLDQRFTKRQSDLNERSYSFEKIEGLHKWDIPRVAVHAKTQQLTKVLQDKHGFAYEKGKNEQIPLSFYFDLSGSMSAYSSELATIVLELAKRDVKALIGFNQKVMWQINKVGKGVDIKTLSTLLIDAVKNDKDLLRNKLIQAKKINMNLDTFLKKAEAEKCAVFSDFDPRTEVISLSKFCKTYWFCFEKTFTKGDLNSFKGFIWKTQNMDDLRKGLVKVNKTRFEALTHIQKGGKGK